jgi:hypothetical protein
MSNLSNLITYVTFFSYPIIHFYFSANLLVNLQFLNLLLVDHIITGSLRSAPPRTLSASLQGRFPQGTISIYTIIRLPLDSKNEIFESHSLQQL